MVSSCAFREKLRGKRSSLSSFAYYFLSVTDPNYRRPAPVSLTSDLISAFGLYDAFQRQVIGHYKTQHNSTHSQPAGSAVAASSSIPASIGGVGKGTPAGQSLPAAAGADDAAGAAKREKKREKDLYKTLFKDLPGKHDTKRDRYLSELLMQAPKEGRIMLLDDMMAEMAFTIFDLPQVCFNLVLHHRGGVHMLNSCIAIERRGGK